MAGVHFNNSNGVRGGFAVDDVWWITNTSLFCFARSGNLENWNLNFPLGGGQKLRGS
jgi:hypothetical protein